MGKLSQYFGAGTSGSADLTTARNFGAAANNTTDDTTAIQSAYNKVQTDGGGILITARSKSATAVGSNNIVPTTIYSDKPSVMGLYDGTQANPSTNNDPALWVQKWANLDNGTDQYAQAAGGILAEVMARGSGVAGTTNNDGTWAGGIFNARLNNVNRGTQAAPDTDGQGSLTGVVGFAKADFFPGEGTAITGIWGYPNTPNLTDTELAALSATNFAIIGGESNIEINHSDVGYREYAAGPSSTIGYWMKNYRTPNTGRRNWNFGWIVDGTPVDGNYISTTVSNWNGHWVGGKIDDIKKYGILFGRRFANDSILLKGPSDYFGMSERPLAFMDTGDNPVIWGTYTGSNTQNGMMWQNGGDIFLKKSGVAYELVLNNELITFSRQGASSVNSLNVIKTNTTFAPVIAAQGSDTNVGIELRPKGTGNISVTANSIQRLAVAGNTGFVHLGGAFNSESLIVGSVASQVNRFEMYGAATGQTPALSAAGSDANVGIELRGKGTGSVFVNTNGGIRFGVMSDGVVHLGGDYGTEAVRVTPVTSAVNRLEMFGAIANASPTIAATGTSTNIGLELRTKGTGSLFVTNNSATVFGVMSDGVSHLGGAYGSEAVRVTPVASAVNRIEMFGAAANESPTIAAMGTSANIGLEIRTKNTGSFFVTNNSVTRFGVMGDGVAHLGGAYGSESVRVSPIALAVNRLEMFGAIANASPAIAATGTSTNIGLELRTKGTGSFFITNNSVTRFGVMNDGVAHLGGDYGVESVRVSPVTSAVNRLEMFGAIANASPAIAATGTSTNIGLEFRTKGTGSFFVTNNSVTRFGVMSDGVAHLGGAYGAESVRVSPVTSAVNRLEMFGAATTATPAIAVTGTDTSIGLELRAKGTAGSVFVTTNGVTRFGVMGDGVAHLGGAYGAESLRVTPVTSSVNRLEVFGAATTATPAITAIGTDNNVGIELRGKGTGNVFVTTNGVQGFAVAGTGYVHMGGAFGAESLIVGRVPSAVNKFEMYGAITNETPAIAATGSDANVGMELRGKGTGNVFVTTNGVQRFAVAGTGFVHMGGGFGAETMIIGSVANQVNKFEFYGAAATSAPAIVASGSDTNINIELRPKGTGRVLIGPHSFQGGGAITGYIEVRDSTGTLRKLAVIS